MKILNNKNKRLLTKKEEFEISENIEISYKNIIFEIFKIPIFVESLIFNYKFVIKNKTRVDSFTDGFFNNKFINSDISCISAKYFKMLKENLIRKFDKIILYFKINIIIYSLKSMFNV